MRRSRRNFLTSLSRTALVLALDDVLSLSVPAQQQGGNSRPAYSAPARPAPKLEPSPVAGTPLGYSYVDVARSSGLNTKTIYGGEQKNRFLLETTGCGVAFFDYDQDDWLDIFLVNGSRLDGFAGVRPDQVPISRLFKNNRDGTFTDVTQKSGLGHSGWGQGCCVGDYDNDGWNDLFVTYYGQNMLYRNNGNGTFTEVTAKAGLLQPPGPGVARAGIRAARFSTTTRTGISTCSWPTTSILISKQHPCRKLQAVPTRESRWHADRRVWKAAKISCTTTTATEPSPM